MGSNGTENRVKGSEFGVGIANAKKTSLNELFDMADELEYDIITAQEHLEKIYDVLSSITDCWPDPDEEDEEEGG